VAMATVIHKKGVPENFVWEETKVGAPERGQVRLRSTAVGVNFADTYHRAGIPHPMIVGDPPVVLGFEGVGEIEESWVLASPGFPSANEFVPAFLHSVSTVRSAFTRLTS
jgi:NADPH:quinone reductase-like Zn-dependent oxidoreductase